MASDTNIVTGIVRGSYVNIFQPKLNDQGEPRYSMMLLIPKSDTATIERIKAAQAAAVKKKWPNKPPAKINYTLHDGDGVKPESGEPYGPECKGCFVMNVSSKNQPGIVDAKRNPILDPKACVSGDYYRVDINAYGYEGKKSGVTFGLNNVQFVRRGEPLGNTRSAEAAFDDGTEFDEEATGFLD